TSNTGADWLNIEAKSLQRPSNEGAIGQFGLQSRMLFEPRAGREQLAVAIDRLAQACGPVSSLTSQQQQLDATGVMDRVLTPDPVPQRAAGLTEGSRWIKHGFCVPNQCRRLHFLHKKCFTQFDQIGGAAAPPRWATLLFFGHPPAPFASES